MSSKGRGGGSKGGGKSGSKGGGKSGSKGRGKSSSRGRGKSGGKGRGSSGSKRGGGGGRGKGRGGRSGSGRKGGGEAMGGLEGRVVAALAASERGPMKTKELARDLDIDSAEYRSFRSTLGAMEKRGTIYKVRGGRYAVSSKLDLVTGVLSMTRRGDGFLRPDDAADDVFVPAQRLKTAMDGDRAVVRIERKPRGRSPEGSVIRVLERAREQVVGTLHEGRRVTYVTPLDARLERDVLITSAPPDDDSVASDPARPDSDALLREAEEGDVVVVRITSYGEGRVGPTGVIERVLGPLSDPGVDVLAVAYGFGVSLDFPHGLDAAAKAAARDGMADQGPDRVDRTDLTAFTIDPADAKDHDDALSVEVLEGGRVEVGVHIADVSHFVTPDSPVDVEAYARGTSVYLVDRTVPMLPAVLSNDVCSLNAGEPKLAVSVFMTLDGAGAVTDRRYERTIIECSHSLSYEDAQAVLSGEGSVSDTIDHAIRTLDDRARKIRAARRARGALDLDIPEAKVILDEEGEPIDIRRRDRLESHRLIEDYMVLANEVVAGDLESADLSAMYRVHEPPAPEKVSAMTETLARFSLKVPRRKTLKPKDIQALVDAVRGREEESLVNSLILRSLSKARYHTENLGHFGLASTGYAHFTSPIRRYPDLVVHRVVTEVLVHGHPEPYKNREALTLAAEHLSSRERAAEEAERASVALKKVEFMERHLGSSFSGRVTGVAAFGFFVTLEDVFVEGLVHVSGLHDDFYHYREGEHSLVGERGGKRFRLGDRVEVQVARVDKEARHVDFEILRKLQGRSD